MKNAKYFRVLKQVGNPICQVDKIKRKTQEGQVQVWFVLFVFFLQSLKKLHEFQ